MKRENLTWQELWPLIGDGQCFDYQGMHGSRPFKYVDGTLYVWSVDTLQWNQVYNGLERNSFYKLVDDPSQPKPPPNHLQKDLEDYAISIFCQLETPYIDGSEGAKTAKKDCVKALVSMFEALRADLLREIEEKTK